MSDETRDDLRPRPEISALFAETEAPLDEASAVGRAMEAAAARLFGGRHDGEPHPSGHRLGSYVIEHLLGSGGQARVYQARHAELGRRVALKVPTRTSRAALVREARLSARVAHPNIVRIETIVDEADVSFLVMELCSGGSLADLLARRPLGLAVADASTIALAILEALAFAHGRGVVHRDVKPSNVLFDDRGQTKVSDLGIGSITTRLTGTTGVLLADAYAEGGPVGTPAYVAPEQAAQGQDAWLDGRADLFSFGRLLFTMLSGRPPRESATPASTCRADLDPGWDELIARLTAVDPEDRPDSAEEAAELLSGLI